MNEQENNMNQQQPIVQQADPNMVADLVMAKLFQASGQNASPQQQSLVNEVARELQQGNFDEGFIEGIAKAVAKVDQQINQRLDQAVRQYSEEQKHGRASDIVRDTISSFAEADELIGYASSAIYDNVVKKFNHDPALSAERSRFGQNIVDRSFWAQLAKDEVLKFYKKAGKDGPQSKGPSLKPTATSNHQTPPAADPKETELSGMARQRYEGMKAAALRSGVPAEEAEKRALASAKRFL